MKENNKFESIKTLLYKIENMELFCRNFICVQNFNNIDKKNSNTSKLNIGTNEYFRVV